ncbi:hypothetical protein MFLO_11939 [Listeria floridensis FSL S10-1187]|uniref:Crp/Fnr family transcriptional regulator n=1 Tax=Listeria floridensis FSL S10-1187 TaxID=1265817 RepID=A0ABP3AW53_9LIST|nr:hypothetical protein [Listeria floridensis]EUJ28854.1 hypothetical protein MFLO_11939 [Listeria floridensis FSL S10-1187]
MEFFEFQKFIKEDAILFSLMKNKVRSRSRSLKSGEEFHLRSSELLLVESGAIAEKYSETTSFFYRIYDRREFVYNMRGKTLVIEALSPASLFIMDITEAWSFLESEKLLDSFLYLLLEKTNNDLKNFYLLASFLPSERIPFVVEQQYLVTKNITLPRWMNVKTMARIANCSLSTTSKIINEMGKDQAIYLESKPWQVNVEKLRDFIEKHQTNHTTI